MGAKDLEEWMEIRSISNEPVPYNLLSSSHASLVVGGFAGLYRRLGRLMVAGIPPHLCVAYWLLSNE